MSAVIKKPCNDENLLGRQKKLQKNNLKTRRPALSDLESNTSQSVRNTTKTVPQNEEIRKPKTNEANVCDIIDVDAKDKGDPYLVSEYVLDIFKYLRTLENEYPVKKAYLATHRTTSRMRSVLVNWMVEMHVSFKLMLETFHLSVGILDRYLQINNTIGKDNLQLVGVTAMVMAAKFEEIYTIPLNEYADITDNYFTCDDIKKMEVDILIKLNFELGRPLSLHFLRRYNKVANVSAEQHNLAKYLLELCLLHYEFCHVNPSLQAAAATCLSISILTEVSDPCKVWTKTLVRYSSYKYSDIKPTVIKLAYFLHKMEKSKYLAIPNKFASSSYGKISTHSKLRGPLVTKLADLIDQKPSK